MSERRTLLVRVSGRDRPGITAALFGILSRGDVAIYDIEQIAVRQRLTLDILINLPAGDDILKDLLFLGWEQDLDIDFEVVEDTNPRWTRDRHAVTVIGEPLTPANLKAVAGAIADAGANIERILRLSRYPVLSFELSVSGGDASELRQSLGAAASAEGIDIAVQREGLGRRAKRLVVLDVDSTLIQNEAIDLLAEEAGCAEEVRDLTDRAMAGELDFETALRDRVRLLKGTPVDALARAAERVELTAGARTFIRTLHRLGYRTAIVSGGFDAITERLRADLGVGHSHANTLEVVDGVLTGELVGPIVDRKRKADLLAEIAETEGIPLEQTVAVGDGANDLEMLARAGLGIAFNARPAVSKSADTAVSVPYLDAILFILGIRREDVEAADAEDPSIDTRPIPIDGLPPQ